MHSVGKPPLRAAKVTGKWPGKEVKVLVGTRITIPVKGRSYRTTENSYLLLANSQEILVLRTMG